MKGRDASFGRRAIVIGMSVCALAVDVSAQQELGLGLSGGWSQIAFVQRAHTSIKSNGLGAGFGGRVWFEMGRSVFLTWGLFVARCGIDEHETYPGVLSPSGLAKHTTGTLSRYELEMGLGGTVKRSAKFSLRIFGAVQAIAWTSYAGQVSTEPSGTSESFSRDLTGQKSDIGVKLAGRFMRRIATPVWVGLEPFGSMVVRDGARFDVAPGDELRPSAGGVYGCLLVVELCLNRSGRPERGPSTGIRSTRAVGSL
jgi:hypothetical protein